MASPTDKRDVNIPIGLARSALGQGLGMGWGDEGEAWLRSKLGEGSYDDLVRRIRSEQSAFGERYPITSGVSEFVGGAAPGIAAMFIPGMQPVAGQQVARSTGAALARLAATGALTGAVSGAGSADEGDRAAGAAAGTVLGGAFGVATPVAIRSATAAGRWLRDKLAPSAERAAERAADKFNAALRDSDMTPDDLRRRMTRDRRLGVPSVVANADPGLGDLAEAVAQRSGRSARKVESALGEQKRGSRERTYGQVKSKLGGGDFYADEERLVSDLRQKATGLYDQAYAHGDVDDPRITEALKNPQFQAFYRKARSIADTEAQAAILRGEDPSRFMLPEIYMPSGRFDASGNEILELTKLPDVRTLDYIKRGIDATIDRGFGSDNSLSKAEAAGLRALRKEFVNALDENVPAYRDARRTYAGDIEVIDAMRAGMNDFGKMDHEQIRSMVSGMSPAELEAFRTGVVRDLYGRIMNPSTSRNSAANIIGSPEMRQKLEPLFETPAKFRLFQSALEREAQLFQQSNRILGGSQTAKRTQMRDALESDPGIGEVVAQGLTGGFWNSLTSLAARVARAGSMNDETAAKLADMLMSKDPSEVAAVVRMLEDRAASVVPRAYKAGAVEYGTTTGAATSIWPDRGDADAPPPEIETAAPGVTPAAGPDIEEELRRRLEAQPPR